MSILNNFFLNSVTIYDRNLSLLKNRLKTTLIPTFINYFRLCYFTPEICRTYL